jgi:anti-anti-sigma factor
VTELDVPSAFRYSKGHEEQVRLNIIRNRQNDVTLLDIQGVIKLGESAREFSSYLEKVLQDETGPVVINFEGINYMDSTGLGELIGYLQKFEDRQRKMVLVKPSHRIIALLKITKLDTVFKIFDSREDALRFLGGADAALNAAG